MTKYVIDLPDGTTAVVAKKPYFLNETDVMRIPASQLELYVEPTVEKRVIELPAEMIKDLEYQKKETLFRAFERFVNSITTEQANTVALAVPESTDTNGGKKIIADWYLHPELVEFVPKKEPKFYIRICDVFDVDGNDLYLTSMGNNKFRMTIYTDSAGMFTEEEADKIIADVSNSDVSLTARKAEVEE